MKKVVIIQRNIPHYRKKFFELLRLQLLRNEIDLYVIHGARDHAHHLIDAPKWATFRPLYWFGQMSWHRSWGDVLDADLVIVPQEVKCLSNLTHFIVSRFTSQKFAYWGHGRNFQSSNPNSPAEKLKRFLSRHVDWWFAYNDLSARVLRGLGFLESNATVVQNSIDTAKLLELKSSWTEGDLLDLRAKHGIHSQNVAVFTGGFSDYKRLDFLIRAAELIKTSIPDFELIIIGDGPNRDCVESAADRLPWVHWLGKMNDEQKVPYWLISKFVAMPGLVGLVVVDCFALGVPMIASDYPYSSPEIDYLNDGVNGVKVQGWESEGAYAQACIDFLKDPEQQRRLQLGCEESRVGLSVEQMSANMAEGIQHALSAPKN